MMENVMPKNIYHNHHIIPKYRCKEIGIDPDFPENIIRITRAEHAEAHYHRWLKHKDLRDLGAVAILTKGEIDGLDTSGDKNPFYGKKHSAESRKKMSDASSGEKNYFYGKHLSEEHKKNMSVARKGIPQAKITCPHCQKKGGKSLMKRYHFDNCREIA